jgi:hypothetical protein
MNLNHFETVNESTLNQILQTLDHVHGVRFNIDFGNSNLIGILSECKNSYEIIRDKIIDESAFNTYQTNPEYIKSMLVLEAVKMLIEIAPKRMRKHKMSESLDEKVLPGQSSPTTTLSAQLAGVAAKISTTDDKSAAFANALSHLSDSLAHRGSSWATSDSELDDNDKKLLSWIKEFPRPIKVSDLIQQGVEQFGDTLATDRKSATALYPKAEVDEIISPNPSSGSPSPVQPTGTNPLDFKKSVPGTPPSNNNTNQQQIDDIVSKHKQNQINPAQAQQQLQSLGVQPADVDNVLNGNQDASSDNKSTNISNNVSSNVAENNEMSSPVLQKIVALGQAMMGYGEDIPQKSDDKQLAIKNAILRVGEKLTHMGTAFGPKSLSDNEKKIVRLYQLKVKNNLSEPAMEENIGAMQAQSNSARPGMGNVMNEDAVARSHNYKFQGAMARGELVRNTTFATSMMAQIHNEDFDIDKSIIEFLKNAKTDLLKVYKHLNRGGKEEDLKDHGDDPQQLLLTIQETSSKLFDIIEPDDRLENWVEMALTNASHCVSQAKHYLEHDAFGSHANRKSKIKESFKVIKKMKTKIKEFQEVGGKENLDKANVLIAAKGIVSKIQDMAEDVGKLSIDELMPLVDMMRDEFGPEVSDGFNNSFKSALDKLLDLTTTTKNELASTVDTLVQGGVPGQGSDLGSTSPEGDLGGDELGGDTSDLSGDLTAGPETGDDLDNEEPLGRAKKSDDLGLSEGKKGKIPPQFLKGKKGDKKDNGKKKSLPPWLKKFDESAPPGKAAADFIKDATPNFKKEYGKDWEKRLYATAWKKFGESSESYNRAGAVLQEAKRIRVALENKLASHKKSYSKMVNEGKVSDPLGLGYGLEGDAINAQIRRINKKIAEAKSVMLHEMQKGINSLIATIKKDKKIASIKETRQNTPYGVIYKSLKGRKSCKMFESADIRSHWLNLRGNSITSIQMIEPETFDRAIETIAR